MNSSNQERSTRPTRTAAVVIGLACLVGVVLLTDVPKRLGVDLPWKPASLPALDARTECAESGDHDHQRSDPSHDDHDHNEHAHGETIELSSEARANLSVESQRFRLTTYTEYVEVPAVVTSWPGRTHIAVTSPLTGVISSIAISRGEVVRSGETLFRLRLTHQDLVKTQEQFLSQLGQLDVEEKELQRLNSIRSGAVAGKTRISREYERDKLLAGIRAARQAMLLHGLSESQIKRIESTRRLVHEVVVIAPEIHEDHSLHHESDGDANARMTDQPSERYASLLQPPPIEHGHRHIDAEFLVSQMNVRRGQSVEAGEPLAELSDYSELLIEGHAFQRDSDALRKSAESQAPVQALFESSSRLPELIDGLKISYIGNEVDRETRALSFFVALENEVERSETRGEHRYLSWKYKPGQRMKLRLPISHLDDVFVVPKDAVVEEGPERFVFLDHGHHFDRVPVHVVAKDSVNAALAGGGKLVNRSRVTTRGAHQLQMAMKNQSGGAIDPHAGHSH